MTEPINKNKTGVARDSPVKEAIAVEANYRSETIEGALHMAGTQQARGGGIQKLLKC